jgi:hypothetical protein
MAQKSPKLRRNDQRVLSFLRRATTDASSKLTSDGRKKEGGYKPRPITLPSIEIPASKEK